MGTPSVGDVWQDAVMFVVKYGLTHVLVPFGSFVEG
jgi:hypothetical protein